MLNFLRSSKLEFRHSFNEAMAALGMGMFIAAVFIVWEETDAQQEIVTFNFNLPRIGAGQQQKVVSESEVAQDQAELTHLKSRVHYLMQRQEERDDLIDVQAILLAQTWGRQSGVGELSSLDWQRGKLEFEGLTLAPEDWHTLLDDLNLFDRWKTAPQIFRAHRAITKSLPSSGSQVEVKLKANLWAHASNSLSTKTAP
jgi:hypothetical protein